MLRLTLVRHASTLWNEEGRYEGWTDTPLSERGVVQATELSRRLEGEWFDYIVTSDLHRCWDTAEIAYPAADIIPDPSWREMNFGSWEGLTFEECSERDGSRFRGWITHPAACTPPGGEAFGDFSLRVDGAIKALPQEGSALVVTHSGTIRVILARLLDLGFRKARRFAISACGITQLELHPDGTHIVSVNVTR